MSYEEQVLKLNKRFGHKTMEHAYPESSTIKSEIPSNIDAQCNKSKRTRTVFTSFQLFQLESIFKSHKYLCRKQRIIVALKLSLCEKQVKIWFQNRRMKCKKEQQLLEAKPTKNKAQSVTEQTVHKGTVQRLMAYSRSPAIISAEKLSCGNFTAANTSTNNNNSQSCRSDLNEILDLLEETSPTSSQNSSSSSSNVTFNTDVQAIKQDLELAAQDWLTNTICYENHGSSNGQPISTLAQHPQQLPQLIPNVPSVRSMPAINMPWTEFVAAETSATKPATITNKCTDRPFPPAYNQSTLFRATNPF